MCFSIVPPLWELCYSLAPSDDEAVLGNASGEGCVLKEELLVPLSLFSFLFLLFLFFRFFLLLFLPVLTLSSSLSLPSSPFPSLFPSRSQSLFPSLFLFLEIFSIFEGTVCTVHSRDVRDDTSDCNQLYLYWNKEQYLFLKHEFEYSKVCNFLGCYLAKLSAFFFFFLLGCLKFLSIRILNKVINEHTDYYLKADNILLKIKIRGLLIETLEVFSVPRMR